MDALCLFSCKIHVEHRFSKLIMWKKSDITSIVFRNVDSSEQKRIPFDTATLFFYL